MACGRACLPFCVSSVHPHFHDCCAVSLCLCRGYRVPVWEAWVSLCIYIGVVGWWQSLGALKSLALQVQVLRERMEV